MAMLKDLKPKDITNRKMLLIVMLILDVNSDCNATDAGADQSILASTILEKIKETRPNFFQESITFS